MKVGQMFPSKYVKTADLGGKPVVVTMDRVVFEAINDQDGASETKPVLYFRESQRGLVLNQTNSYEIAANYGEDTDEWIGHKIELYPTRVQFGKKMVDAIRVRAPHPSAGQSPQTAPVQHPVNSQFVAPPVRVPVPGSKFNQAGDPGPASPDDYGAKDPFGGDPGGEIPF